jgi:hypothetical protein
MVMARVREQEQDLFAVVTAVLPMMKTSSDESVDWTRRALEVIGVGSRTDRDLALLAGAVRTARMLMLLGDALDADPEEVWKSYRLLADA